MLSSGFGISGKMDVVFLFPGPEFFKCHFSGGAGKRLSRHDRIGMLSNGVIFG
jgi:hypothetical protein